VLEAAHLRLRPILMTSMAFIMGVVPLVLASGAGAEVRHALGVTVFAGMLGVTAFGLLLTPVFYVFVRRATAHEAAPAPLPPLAAPES
jgi:gold/copper resistance efflux pump